MGRALYLCERLDLPNVGVTLDVGHALMAKETPAAMACLAAQSERLFYVHFNDNGREWDWDMLPGSVNCWDLVETLFYLDRLDWRGWLCYDVLTRNGDPIEQMNATIAIMESAERLLAKMGPDALQQCIDDGIPAATYRRLWERLA
jgi:xylose isomerase